ncbi:MAG: 4Fe-4S binding protein [Chloroflexi bacterium]|nr:4Fe-4S binding protein [Chloroflexota bacterium]
MEHPWQKARPISPWIPGGLSRHNREVSRVSVPKVDMAKCTMCSLCWIYCPDGVISRQGKIVIDYEYCKGCGVCAEECPVQAIEMVVEERL